MDIKILKDALKHYAQSADCPTEDRDKVLESIGECQATIDRIIADGWDENGSSPVCVVPSIFITDCLNMATYDVYGKIAKQHGGECKFDYYMRGIQDVGLGFNLLTAAQAMCGYDFLSDLWRDNEEYGENNPDGTFKHSSDKLSLTRNMLRRIRRRLNDKLTVDRDVMEADDIEALLEEIDYVENALKRNKDEVTEG